MLLGYVKSTYNIKLFVMGGRGVIEGVEGVSGPGQKHINIESFIAQDHPGY